MKEGRFRKCYLIQARLGHFLESPRAGLHAIWEKLKNKQTIRCMTFPAGSVVDGMPSAGTVSLTAWFVAVGRWRLMQAKTGGNIKGKHPSASQRLHPPIRHPNASNQSDLHHSTGNLSARHVYSLHISSPVNCGCSLSRQAWEAVFIAVSVG